MSLHADLLKQARLLALHDAKKPTQANLRRSVSAAYYSLFHLLSEETGRRFVGGPKELAARVTRALDHGEMKSACRAFLPGTTSALLKSLYPLPFSRHLQEVARAFVDLQEARHRADYDTMRPFSRAESLTLHRRASEAHYAWEVVRGTDEAKVFLAALLFAKRWDR